MSKAIGFGAPKGFEVGTYLLHLNYRKVKEAIRYAPFNDVRERVSPDFWRKHILIVSVRRHISRGYINE